MSRATNAGAQGSAGSFATCRRGGLTGEEIREIEAHRSKDRPTPWQALAARYGRPVEDIKAAVGQLPEPVTDLWPFGEATDDVKAVIRSVALRHALTLEQLASVQSGGGEISRGRIWEAQRDLYATVFHTFQHITLDQLSGLFKRDRGSLHRMIRRHTEAANDDGQAEAA